MDPVSRALTQAIPHGVRDTLRGRAEHFGVSRSTLHDRKNGRPSIKAKAEGQQYLTPCEKNAIVRFVLQMAELGQDVRIKHLPSLAFTVATNIPLEAPCNDWPRGFKKRNPDLMIKRKHALDWKRYNIYEKTEHWFEVIGKVLQSPDVNPGQCLQHGRDWSHVSC
jgi:hypothetical protein